MVHDDFKIGAVDIHDTRTIITLFGIVGRRCRLVRCGGGRFNDELRGIGLPAAVI